MINENVLSIGYGKNLFNKNSSELERLIKCAEETPVLHLIVFTLKRDGFTNTSPNPKLHLYPTNSANKLFSLFDAIKIGKKLIKGNNFIITPQDPFESGLVGWMIALSTNSKLVIQLHSDFYTNKFWRYESIGNLLRFYFGKFILKQADLIRVVSERIIKDVRAINPKVKINKLPVAIDITKFLPTESKPAKAYFASDKFVFLSVARFVREKNFPLMIRAFHNEYKLNSELRLLLVGKGPLKTEIEALVKSLFGNEVASDDFPVKIVDWSNDVATLMQQADAYLLTSNYEGWGRVLVEAMCLELPIVTTDVGCAGELLIGGEHGLIVPPNNQLALELAIRDISTNRDLYQHLKTNLKAIDKNTLAGVDINSYGRVWADSLA